MEKQLLTVSEAAKILSVGRTTAYDLVRIQAIPSIRLNKAIRIPKAALMDFIESMTRLPDS